MPHFGNLIIKPILYLPEVKRSSRVRCVHELFQELSNVLRLDIKVQGNQDFRELVNISKLSTSAGETAQRPVPPLFFSFFFCPPSTNKSAAPTTLSHLENDVEALWSSQIQFDFFSRSHWPLSVIACVKKILMTRPSLLQTSNTLIYLQLQSLSSTFIANINQTCSGELVNLTVLCKCYFAYLFHFTKTSLI